MVGRRRLRAATGGAMLIGAALLLVLPVRADAATLAKAGWWWRVNDGSLPTPAPSPPNVPEGGLMVAGAPDGATAIAALHFAVSDNETSPVLTLTVAPNGDQGGSTAILAACLTGSAWDTTSAGGWAFKPFPACDQGSVNGIRSDDGATWTFGLEPLLSGGIVDVTLVPGVDPSRPQGADGSTFQLAFNPPTAASLTTTPGSAPSTDFPAPDFGAPAGGDNGTYDPSAGGTFGFPAVPTESGFTAALPPADQGLTATAPVVQGRNAPLRATPAAAVADHKGLAALVLVLCGGALLWSAQLPVPEPRRLGTFTGPSDARRRSSAEDGPPSAPPEPGGLGRFARSRSGAVPRL